MLLSVICTKTQLLRDILESTHIRSNLFPFIYPKFWTREINMQKDGPKSPYNSVTKENLIMPTNWLLWFLKYGFYLELAVSRYNLMNIIESLFAEWRSYRAPESSFWMSVFIVTSLLSIWPPHSFGKTVRFAFSILIFIPLGQTLFCFLLDYSSLLDSRCLHSSASCFQSSLPESLLVSVCHPPLQEIMMHVASNGKISVCRHLTPLNLVQTTRLQLAHSLLCTLGPASPSFPYRTGCPFSALSKSHPFFKAHLTPLPSSWNLLQLLFNSLLLGILTELWICTTSFRIYFFVLWLLHQCSWLLSH